MTRVRILHASFRIRMPRLRHAVRVPDARQRDAVVPRVPRRGSPEAALGVRRAVRQPGQVVQVAAPEPVRHVRRSTRTGRVQRQLTTKSGISSSPFLRAFRHRNYRLFFGGQLISLTGTWMQSVAESWLVFRLTGSSALLGLSAFASQIPVLLLASVGGIVADRSNRQRILIATQSVSMLLPLILAVLTLTHHVRVWHVFVLASCLGIGNALDIPARQAFVMDMVGREDLVHAIALNSSMVNGARVVGPSVAGLLVGAVGEGWCFLLNAVSYIAVITGLLLMRLERPAPRP